MGAPAGVPAVRPAAARRPVGRSPDGDQRDLLPDPGCRPGAGCRWRDLPEGFGNWKTVYNRHRRWSLDGTWEQILDGLRAGCDEAEGKDWTVSADSTVARAHQHAAGARRVPAADDPAGGFSE